MTDFLVKRFVKDYEDIEKVSVRTAYGVLASLTGIFCNVFLFLVKGSIGLLLQSLSVLADAFNNLSDAGSSIVGLVGVKMAASRPTRSILSGTAGSNISRRWWWRSWCWRLDLPSLRRRLERSGIRRK